MISRTPIEQNKENPQIETLSQMTHQMNQIDQSDATDNSQNPNNRTLLSFNPLTEKEIRESTKAEISEGDETEMGI